MTEHCPYGECPGFIEDGGECSMCGLDYIDKHVGWVFVDDETEEVIGLAAPEDYVDADMAVQKFDAADDFGVFYQDASGERHSCDAESRPSDFEGK